MQASKAAKAGCMCELSGLQGSTVACCFSMSMSVITAESYDNLNLNRTYQHALSLQAGTAGKSRRAEDEGWI